MILPLTATRTTFGSKQTPQVQLKGHQDVWSYVQGTMLRLGCIPRDQYIFESENHAEQVPPFACSFAKMTNSSHLLAVVDEDGFVTLFDTRHSAEVVKVFRAHKNAVFDVAWAEGKNQLVTASGDQMAALWDVVAGKALGVFMGHSCSLKSVCFRPEDCHVFATGARDGNILVWDTRCNNRGGSQVSHHTAVNVIKEAHAEASTLRNTPSRKRNRLSPSMPVRGDNLSSVTVVNFQDDMSLFSAGATDRTIKVWDLRKCNKGMKKAPTPRQVYPYTGSSIKNGGFSSLAFNSTRSEFFASCTDDVIYRYSTLGSPTQPIATYSGHRNSSFYVKSALSRDDGLLLSGSGNSKAYIWNVDRPQSAPVTLCGHEDEVTMVAWAEDDFPKLVTGADDSSIRIWRLHKHEDSTNHQSLSEFIGYAERPACSNQIKENLPSVIVKNGVSSAGNSTPPRQNRAKSDELDPKRASAPTTPTTPKLQTKRNSSISEWLKGSPKMSSKDRDIPLDVENSCPIPDSKVPGYPKSKTQEGRPSILGPCVNQDKCNHGHIGTTFPEQIIVKDNSVLNAAPNTSSSRGSSLVFKKSDNIPRGDSCSAFPGQRNQLGILGSASVLSNAISDEQMDTRMTVDSTRYESGHSHAPVNATRQNESTSMNSIMQKPHQKSAHKSQPAFTPIQTLTATGPVLEKLESSLVHSPLPGRKRKRAESTEEVTPRKENSKNKPDKSLNRNTSVLEAGCSNGSGTGLVKQRSLDLDFSTVREGRTAGRGRGSLTSHAQHQCTCSCSGNYRHPTGTSTASNSTADVAGQTTGRGEEMALGREPPKTNCSGSTRNICFYFRPHSREVKRTYSDSSGIKNVSLSTVIPKEVNRC